MGRGQSSRTIEDKLRIIQFINVDLVDYLPVTVRQIHYKMVKSGYIANKRSEYGRISRLMTELRLDGALEWWKVTDRSRRTVEAKRYTDLEEFYQQKLDELEKHYFRCRVQHQEHYVEVWSEKDALANIFERITMPHCVKLVIVRGQSSTTYVKNYAIRATKAWRNGQTPVLLYAGDLDPSGMAIPDSIESRLMADAYNNIGMFIVFHRIALTPEQVEEHNLPYDFDAIKVEDPNYKRYVDKYGRIAVELDALDPPNLVELLEDHLHTYLDMEAFEEEAKIEKVELKKHRKVVRKIRDLADRELR